MRDHTPSTWSTFSWRKERVQSPRLQGSQGERAAQSSQGQREGADDQWVCGSAREGPCLCWGVGDLSVGRVDRPGLVWPSLLTSVASWPGLSLEKRQTFAGWVVLWMRLERRSSGSAGPAWAGRTCWPHAAELDAQNRTLQCRVKLGRAQATGVSLCSPDPGLEADGPLASRPSRWAQPSSADPAAPGPETELLLSAWG